MQQLIHIGNEKLKYHFHFLQCRIEGNEDLKQVTGRVILKTMTLTRVTTQIQGLKVEEAIKYNHQRHIFLVFHEKCAITKLSL